DIFELDRDGGEHSLGLAPPIELIDLVGVRRDGTVLVVDSFPAWRMLRAGPNHPPIEIASGTGFAWIAFAPHLAHFTKLDPWVTTYGGDLRVVSMAAPSEQPAPIEHHVLLAGWADDDTVVSIVARGDGAALVLEDSTGRHRAEFPVPRPTTAAEMTPIVR